MTVKTRNKISDEMREFLFGILTHADLNSVTPSDWKNRLTGSKLGKTMKKYVPLVIKANIGFGPDTTEHGIGKLVDNLSQVRKFSADNKNPKGDARAMLKSIHAALAVEAVSSDWVIRHLMLCDFDEVKVRKIIAQKLKTSDQFIQALEEVEAHSMYQCVSAEDQNEIFGNVDQTKVKALLDSIQARHK